MKSFKLLAASLTLIALLSTSCAKETITGIDASKPAVTELAIVDAAYNGKTAIFSWNGEKAIAAGAASFTLQLVEDKDGSKPDNYNTTLSTTIKVETDAETSMPVTYYEGKISGQAKGNCYYVRVRANYKNSVFSEWTWLSQDGTEPALFKLGRGIITEGIEDPYMYKVTPTSTGIIVKWDAIPYATGYLLEYKLSSSSDWKSVMIEKDEIACKIKDLPSETSYDVRMLTLAGDDQSEYCETVTVVTRKPGSFKKQMDNADDLLAWLEGGVVEVDASETYEITADIDLDGAPFSAMDEPLLGTFNGNGHTISGVTSALFYQNEGTIKNVKVKGAVTLDGDPEFGALVKTNKGTVSNADVAVDITFASKAAGEIYIGGITCYNEGLIENSSNGGTISVTSNVDNPKCICLGGIAAASTSSLVECTNNGNVSLVSSEYVLGPAVAGIAGYIEGSAVNCTNKGAVTLQAKGSKADTDNKGFLPFLEGKLYASATYATPAAAGIAAYSYSADAEKPLLDGCVNDGAINFNMTSIDNYTATVQRIQAAGIIANPYGLIQNCTNNGKLTFAANTESGSASGGTYLMCCGGIGGGDWFTASQAVTNYVSCTNNGDIDYIKFDKVGSSNSTCGGICGWPGAEASRTNKTSKCVNNGTITFSGTGKARVGGIHGGSGAMDGCINNGKVHCESGDANSAIGGLAGFSSNGLTIQNCQSRGTVVSDIALALGVGGAIGNLGNAENSGKLTNCVIACKVINPESANEKTGMLVGYFNGTTKNTPLGASGAIKVSGIISFGGKSTTLTAGNFTTYLVGTANASATSHPITAVFDSTPYVDPDGGSGSEDSGTSLSAPTNVAVAVSYSSVTVTWDAVDGAEWYVVDYKPRTASEWISTDKLTECKCTLEGLAHGTEYSFRVKAFATTGSGYSSEVNQNTMDEVVLSKPVVTLSSEETSVTASWEAVDKATGYAVEYKLSSADAWTSAGQTDKLTVTINNLKDNTSYDVRVKALGEGGNEGEFCDAVTISTKEIAITYPYTISSADKFVQWLGIAGACVAGDEVILGADIDLSGKEIAAVESFAGILNGNGKSIKNWTSSAPLIKSLTGTVKDLKIDASCKLSFGAGLFGAIANESTGTLQGCTNYAAIKYAGDAAASAFTMGAIAAVAGGSVVDCHNEGAITVELTSVPSGIVGGVIGMCIGTVENCSNKGAITYTGEYVSAKAAFAATSLVTSFTCVPQLGGIVGLASKGFSIKDSNNSGNLSYTMSKVEKYTGSTGLNQAHIAGIVAASSGDITNCINTGNVDVRITASSGTAYNANEQLYRAAGISGGDYFAKGDVNQNSTNIRNCSNSGNITMYNDIDKSNAAMAGIVAWPGVEKNTLTVVTENCSNSGTIKGDGYGKIRIGGIQGGSGLMSGCTNTGAIIAGANLNPASAAGSLCGFHSQGMKIENCNAYGSVTAASTLTGGVGGLIGNIGNAAHTTADGCKVNCVVVNGSSETASGTTGAVVGYFNGTTQVISLGAKTAIKVAGSVNGTALTAENYSNYICGSMNPTENHTINAEFGE